VAAENVPQPVQKITLWSIILLFDPVDETVPASSLLNAATARDSVNRTETLQRFGTPSGVFPLLAAKPFESMSKPLRPDFGAADGKLVTNASYIAAFHPEELLQRYVVLYFDNSAHRDTALKLIRASEGNRLLFAQINAAPGKTLASITPSDRFFANTNAASTSPVTAEGAYQWGLHSVQLLSVASLFGKCQR